MVSTASTAELFFAAGVLVVCAGFLVHMLLPAAKRRRLEEVVRAFMQLMRAIGLRMLGQSSARAGGKAAKTNKSRRSGVPRAVRLVDPPSANLAKLEPKPPKRHNVSGPDDIDDVELDAEAQKEAEQLAEKEALDIIDRARRQARDGKLVDRDGNVYRPDAFKPRQPPHDKLH